MAKKNYHKNKDQDWIISTMKAVYHGIPRPYIGSNATLLSVLEHHKHLAIL